jgi:serine phosphatase RsbU (regulator of sigma subunit)
MVLSRSEQWYLAILDMLREVNLCQPDELPQLVSAVTEPLGADIRIFLVDYEQRVLHELPPLGRAGDHLEVQGTLAGLAFQRTDVQAESGDRRVLWVPLVDSTERLGVLRMALGDSPPASPVTERDPEVQFANLLAHLITAKMAYGDRLQQVRASQPMTEASVLLRQMLPPSTFTTDRLIVSASLQPAYAVGGDAFDYAVDADTAHLAIFDGVGHGMEAGLAVAVALSATRARRRNGESMAAAVMSADRHLNSQFSDSRFVTAVLAQLDLSTGELRYTNAGHPPPIVLRANGDVAVLEEGRRLPLALAAEPAEPSEPGQSHLEHADRLLLYTDGVIHSRNSKGEFFGIERLIDLALRHLDSDETTPESARKINEEVIDFHGGPPEDDATVLILEWSSSAARQALP